MKKNLVLSKEKLKCLEDGDDIDLIREVPEPEVLKQTHSQIGNF